MNETETPTPLTTPAATQRVTRKPRKKETKNLTKREGIWYFHKRVNGKKEFNGRRTPFSLDTTDLIVAKAKRDALLKAGNGAEIDRVLGRQAKPAAKGSEIFAAYRKAPTVRANADTRERNIADFVRLVRGVRGAEFDVEKMSSAEITKQLVKDWQSAKLVAAAEACAGDLAALEAAKRSLNSTLTHVQSLFSAEARDDYGSLYLPPNVKDFTAALPVAARKQEDPTQLTDEVVAALLERIKGLQEEDAGAWTTFQLMVWGGLRNKECLHARESWLEKIPGAEAYRLSMKPAKDFLPKGNSRAVIIPAAIAEPILSALPAPDLDAKELPDHYLVPGKHYTDRHEAVYRRLNSWLKTHGVVGDAGKIAYRLRKYFLKKVEEQQGILFAQAAGGHSALRTLQDHYIGKPKMAQPIKLVAAAAS